MVWRPEQCGAFLDAATGERLYDLYLMASQTGMRRGELCGLRWQDVDIDTGRMEVKVQLSAGGEEGPTKTKAGRRSVPLDAGLLAMLKTHRTEQKKDRMRWGELWVDSGRVFAKEDGDQLEPDAVSETFRKISRKADLPPVRLHAMRSGAATMALAAGIPMKTVSEMLGHASEAITSKIYTAVGDELKREAITSIGALIPRRATGTEKST
jgi:integrase